MGTFELEKFCYLFVGKMDTRSKWDPPLRGGAIPWEL